MKLQDQVAIVTGSSKGLGKGIVMALAAEGALVVVNYKNSKQEAEAVVASIEALGGKAIAFQADVTDEEQVKRMICEVSEQVGPIEILVNNATGPQPMLSLEECTWQSYLDQLEFFVKAPLLLLKELLPAMKQRGKGRIVQIGSEVVELGNANFSNYVTAKAAMVGMTRAWANELGPFGITVNLVAPGFIPVERHQEVSAFDLASYANRVPLRRTGEPLDIGSAVCFLASDEAKFITGQTLHVNGGNTFC